MHRSLTALGLFAVSIDAINVRGDEVSTDAAVSSTEDGSRRCPEDGTGTAAEELGTMVSGILKN